MDKEKTIIINTLLHFPRLKEILRDKIISSGDHKLYNYFLDLTKERGAQNE